MINSAVEWCWIDLFLMGMTGMRSEKEKREVGLGRLVEHGVRDSKVDRTELHLIPGTRLYRKTVFPLPTPVTHLWDLASWSSQQPVSLKTSC